jgi:hypothetical protein
MTTATGHTLININKRYDSIEFWDRLLVFPIKIQLQKHYEGLSTEVMVVSGNEIKNTILKKLLQRKDKYKVCYK